MTEAVIAHYEKHQRLKSVAKAFGFCLPVLAVIVACCISLLRERAIPIERPVVLVLGAILMLVPFKSELPSALQKIVSFYMVGILVNESSSQYFQIPFLLPRISISCSTIVLSLCTIGYLCGRMGSADKVQRAERTDVICGWVLALVVIVVHMALLSVLLKKFYGYGYERNLSVLGSLCLYLLLFTVLWDKFAKLRFRQCIGLILAIFYLVVTDYSDM